MNHRRRQNVEEISISATSQSPSPKGLALAKFSLRSLKFTFTEGKKEQVKLCDRV